MSDDWWKALLRDPDEAYRRAYRDTEVRTRNQASAGRDAARASLAAGAFNAGVMAAVEAAAVAERDALRAQVKALTGALRSIAAPWERKKPRWYMETARGALAAARDAAKETGER